MDNTARIPLLYHTYNSLFLRLPFKGIEHTGTQLALFTQYCEQRFKEFASPVELVTAFWKDYFEHSDEDTKHQLLFRFIQYVERQVVLFDSVEDALFEQTHEMNGPGSLKHLLSRLETPDHKAQLIEKIKTFNLRLVLTAHPTQFYPGKVLGIINDMGQVIKGNDLEHIRQLLMQLGKTAFVNRQKPTPYDEAISLGWYMEHVFYNTMPDILFRLLRSMQLDVVEFENPRLLSLGFWPGGDRDGNPFVTADVTLLVAKRLREGVLRGYYRDLRQLKRRLTFRGVEEIISAAEQKIYRTLYYPDPMQYHSCGELLGELYEARNILLAEHDGLFMEELERFILKVRVFGFYFASLDIRQESGKHQAVWALILQNWAAKFPWYDPQDFFKTDENTQIDRLLSTNYLLDAADFQDPLVLETIATFQAIAAIQSTNGEHGCHRYIISNCSSALQVAQVLALARLTIANLDEAGLPGTVPLDIVPLFETIDDLATCDTAMETLYRNERYAAHLLQRGNIQHIMLGFSDGTKDGGYLRANWSIYRAKEALTRVSRAHGVTVIFFDGRGGPPGRGGGNNANYYAAQGHDIENQAIHVTIQGQTVSSTYGTKASARFNTERLLSAGLETQLFPTHSNELTENDKNLLDTLSDKALEAYLKLKNHPEFVPYLEKMTPLKWYGDTNIASRPTKRGNDKGLRFEDLRAIPFVGAWAQMKQNVPGYYGVGSAIEALTPEDLNDLRDLYKRSLFLRTLFENSMQSLSKGNFNVTRHIADSPRFGAFWTMLKEEFERTNTHLLNLSGQEGLLEDNLMSKTSIAIREQIVLPLIVIQQYALQQLQEAVIPAASAEVYRRLVLRAMFGIINAARNSA
ncbi:MAG: phosphoenolpyruvate carboxylase [Saprospiraceae bacterium]|nr:phosphoenolpyruvate carboxylase [Saprospiraceae bacterium]